MVKGAIVLLSLAFLTPLLAYIPTCAMAATIMMGAIDVISFHKVGFMWRTNSKQPTQCSLVSLSFNIC